MNTGVRELPDDVELLKALVAERDALLAEREELLAEREQKIRELEHRVHVLSKIAFAPRSERRPSASFDRSLVQGHLLFPELVDPRVNLAMTLEEAGKLDDAIASYSAALEVYPGYLPAIQGMARLTVLSGAHDERLETWLEAIAEQSEDPTWRDWARREASGLELDPSR